jgi:hypothetical protein
MEITAKRQLRAYLFVSATNIDDVAVGKRPHVKGRFDNYGQTPVYNGNYHLDVSRSIWCNRPR